MTTIAYRDGVMAADSQTTMQGGRRANVLKVFKINGFLVGVAGSACMAMNLLDDFTVYAKGKIPPRIMELKPASNNEWAFMLVVTPKGHAYKYENGGRPWRLYGKYHSIGCGSDYAMAAMEMGADAIKAVMVAAKFDINTGLPVKTKKLTTDRKSVLPGKRVLTH